MSVRALLPGSCISCKARHVGLCKPLGADDLSIVENFKAKSRSFEANAHIYHEGDILGEVYNLLDGWVFLYHLLEDGQRQILEILLPGAFFGLLPDLRAPMTHSALCATAVSVCPFPRHRVLDLFREHPELALRMIKICARDRVSIHHHLTDLGRRTARERIAHFLLEFYWRARDRQGPGVAVALPFNQEDLADALGLSTVHVNRILGDLKARGLVRSRRGSLLVENPDILADLAGVNPEENPAEG